MGTPTLFASRPYSPTAPQQGGAVAVRGFLSEARLNPWLAPADKGAGILTSLACWQAEVPLYLSTAGWGLPIWMPALKTGGKTRPLLPDLLSILLRCRGTEKKVCKRLMPWETLGQLHVLMKTFQALFTGR